VTEDVWRAQMHWVAHAGSLLQREAHCILADASQVFTLHGTGYLDTDDEQSTAYTLIAISFHKKCMQEWRVYAWQAQSECNMQ